VVLTRTTELATEVYWSEVIQVAKWSARKIPESSAKSTSRRLREVSSARRLERAMGAKISEATVNRQAAITSEGASFCA
jgi:hypothetical protein